MNEDSTSDTRNLSRRYRQYLLFRLLVVVLSVSLVAFNQVWTEVIFREFAVYYLNGILIAYLLFSIAACLFFKWTQHHSGRIRLQVLIDFIVQSSLVWFTGGVLSIFSPLLFVTLVAATGLISPRDSYVIATLVALVLTLTTVAYALGIVPVASETVASSLVRQYTSYMGPYLVASVLGLFAISALGSRYTRGLRQVEGIQSAILENIAEGLIATDPEGNILQLNREARELLHLGPMDRSYESLPLRSVLQGEGAQEIVEALTTDRNRNFTISITDEEGREHPLEVKVSFVQEDRVGTRCRIALLEDLTLQHEMEAAEQRIRKLEDLHVLALGIAHEIRNPLASIRGCAQEIRRMSGDDDLEQKFMDIICRESDRLDETLEEFLTYARKDPVRRSSINLIDVVDEAASLIKARAAFGGRELEWERGAEDVRILGNRNCLVQLFLNLGLNAVDATDPESGRIWIRVRGVGTTDSLTITGGDEVRAAVEIECGDNGHGFDAAQREQLFSPFFTTKETGNGLGLAIAHRVVDEHDGSIEVSSSPGEGTVFRVRLLLLDSDRARDVREPCRASTKDVTEPCNV